MNADNCFISSKRSNRTCGKMRGKLYWMHILLSQTLAFYSRDEGFSMTLSRNGIALRSDLQLVDRRRLVMPASVVREGASTLLEALGGLFWIDEGI